METWKLDLFFMLFCFYLEADCDMFTLNHFWAFLSLSGFLMDTS